METGEQLPGSALGSFSEAGLPGLGVWGAQGSRADGRGQRRVFVLGLWAVSTETQYFGTGTRLTVLGERGGGRGRVLGEGPGVAQSPPRPSGPADRRG